MQEMTQKTSDKGEISDARVYELGFLMIPTIAEEELGAAYTNLKDVVASFGGEMISDEMPKMINLAYQMLKVTSNVRSKFKTAYFGWIKFYMDADKVVELKKKLDFDPTVIRFLILKTVKENTIAAKRFVRSETYKKPKKVEGEVSAPIDEKEIDKEIDALVAA